MTRRRYTASAVKLPQKSTTSSPEEWGPKVVMGKEWDAIVSRTGCHYVVSIIPKSTTQAQRISATFIHLTEYTKALWSTITNGAGAKPDVPKGGTDEKES